MDEIAPKPEFLSLTEAAVQAALDDPVNPIAIEVARLITAYTAAFQEHVKRTRSIPAYTLPTQPRWPIEAVTLRLMTQAIRQSLAAPESAGAIN